MVSLRFWNARIVDPATGRDEIGELHVRDRVIVKDAGEHARVVDCRGKVLAPGLIDAGAFHVDRAACAAGGITRVCLMPDQSPALDAPALIERAVQAGKPDIWVHPWAAATRALEGRELAEIGLMAEAGAVGVATGRAGIGSAGVMYRLLQYAPAFGLVVVTHGEDATLSENAVATDGETAARLGLAAAPAFAEALAVARDLRLAEATGARLHIRQVTTAESVALVRDAKARGVHVTCGVTPAHMLLADNAVTGYRSFARLSPPLRSDEDRRAVLDGLADGTIDIIASGHDPRTQEEKRLPFADAEPGMAGAETLLALALSLVRDARLALPQVLATMTSIPAALFGLPGGTLAPGEPADLVLFDPDAPWRVDADLMGNTPFDGLPVQGRVLMTVKGGEVIFDR